jgi:hypothetical protein
MDDQGSLPFHFSSDLTEPDGSPLPIDPPDENGRNVNTGNDRILDEEGSITLRRCVFYKDILLAREDSQRHLTTDLFIIWPCFFFLSCDDSFVQPTCNVGRRFRRRDWFFRSQQFLLVRSICI